MLEPIGNLLRPLGALWETLPKRLTVTLSVAFSVAILFRVVSPIVERRLVDPTPTSSITPIVALVFDGVLIFVMLLPVVIALGYLAYFIYGLRRRR